MEITPRSVKYSLILAAIAVSTAGLNLGVMGLTDGESAAQAAVSTDDQTTNADPLQVVVDVPVIVPNSSITAPAEAAADAPTSAVSITATTAPVAAAAAKQPATTAAVATTQQPATTPQPATTQEPTTTQAPTTTAGPTTEYLYFDFSGVASEIIVAKHGDGSLEFWSVTTEAGWNYLVEKDTASKIELKFSRAPNGEGEAKWELTYSGDQLRVKKER